MILSNKRKQFLTKNLMFILAFALIYHSLPKGSFNKPMSLFDSLYFSTITHTTLGYGDFYPESKMAKSLSSIQSFVMFFLITEEFIR